VIFTGELGQALEEREGERDRRTPRAGERLRHAAARLTGATLMAAMRIPRSTRSLLPR
jgi:hypothetical protein